jgi:hypothetical protein
MSLSTYGVWIHDFQIAWISGAGLFGEVGWLKVFYSALYLQIFKLQLFPPISHLIRYCRPAVYLSLLTSSFLCYGDFMKSLVTARKSLRGFWKLSRRSTHDQALTRIQIWAFIKSRSKTNGGGSGESEKSHLKGFYLWYGCRSGEWPTRECQETCSGPWRVSQNGSCSCHDNLQLSKK